MSVLIKNVNNNKRNESVNEKKTKEMKVRIKKNKSNESEIGKIQNK